MLDRLDETIVAVSSAPGRSALGIVRLSGPEVISIVDRMARTAGGEPLAKQPGSTRLQGEIFLDEQLALPATFYLFRSPHSYTREDLIEIHTIGSPPALELVTGRAIELGARGAEPGEFTARAFLHGAMNLAEAESVAGLIRAQTDTQLRASRRMIDGALSKAVSEVRDTLAELLALVEADIDFAEEPIEFITPGELQDKLSQVSRRLQQILRDATPAEQLDALPHILLFGAPNTGKSTLMNRLSGTSRAICAAAAGTTRDVLSAPVSLGRQEAILLDAAGVDQSVDELALIARDMTLSTAQTVDLLCLVVDVTASPDHHVLECLRSLDVGRTVVVANKCDLLCDTQTPSRLQSLRALNLGPVCPVSALTGRGINLLRQTLAEGLSAVETTTLREALVLTQRQCAGVSAAGEAVDRAIALSRDAAETIDCADVLSFEVREALDALGTIIGTVPTEDLLAHVFANFCVGK